jgi:hypothetical protein
MSEAEADQMMQNALALDDDVHMLKRSSTGKLTHDTNDKLKLHHHI